MSTARLAPLAALIGALALFGPNLAVAQSSGGGSSGGGSGGASGAGSAGGTGAGTSSPSYSQSPGAGDVVGGGSGAAPGMGGRAGVDNSGAGGVPGGRASERRIPETTSRPVRCPDGTPGDLNAGGCLGGQ